MSPTVFRLRGYRFFFFSREEARIHVHVHAAEGEAKFWLTPKAALACNGGLTRKQLHELPGIIEEHRDEIEAAWKRHFKA